MIRIFLVSVFSLIWLTGCARTVSDVVHQRIMEVTLTFSQDPAISLAASNSFNYYLIIRAEESESLSNPIKIINPETDNESLYYGTYFPTPGIEYSTDANDIQAIIEENQETDPFGINHYYATFFSSWSDYFLVNKDTGNGLTFFKGSPRFPTSGASNLNAYEESPSNATYSIDSDNKELVLQILLDELSNPDATAIYFTIVSAAYGTTTIIGDSSPTGHIRDFLTEDLVISSSQFDTVGPLNDPAEDALDYEATTSTNFPGADILSVEARIY